MTDPSTLPPFRYDVVIPSHGRRVDLLRQSVHSVLSQSLPPATVVVVLDGCPDLVEEVEGMGGQVRARVVSQARGQANARAVGIGACTSDWVAFLDDDDLWSIDKMQETARFLSSSPNCRAMCAGYWMFATREDAVSGLFGQAVELVGSSRDELERAACDARPLNDLDYLNIRGESLARLAAHNCGVIGTAVIDRELLAALPAVPVGLAPGDDHLLFAHVASKTEWYLLPRRVAFYRVHGGQHSRSKGPGAAHNMIRAIKLIWTLYGEQLPPLRSYGEIYSRDVRQLIWTVVKQTRSVGAGLMIYKEARPLLASRRSRLAALIPEPIVYRLGRMRSRSAQHSTWAPEW